MRYLTKEWYYTMNDSGLGVCLEADERAAACAEEVYQTLRSEKLARWLRDREEVCEVLREPFDPEGEKRRFDEFCKGELERYRARMPERILSKVADLRVLALGFCTEEVLQDFEGFRRESQETAERIFREYRSGWRASGLEKIWTDTLHDSSVLSYGWEGEDLVLEFDREEENWQTVKQIIFRKARILTQEKPLEDAWWLYDEIHRSERGYEIHALLYQDGLAELTVECADVELVWTQIHPEH